MIKYLIKENDKLLVVGALGFVPNNSITEISNDILPEDYPYLRYQEVLDPQFNTTTIEVYIDEDAKTLGDAQKLITVGEMAWANLRAERDRLLTACDYTQLTDSPLTQQLKEAYQVYRQALRDLPNNTVDPNNPVWPESP